MAANTTGRGPGSFFSPNERALLLVANVERDELSGDEIWVDDSGGNGTPVVLIHGDWTDSRVWDPLTGLLRDRYRVVRYDLRGFGRSARPEAPFTRLEDLLAILEDRGIGEAIFVGHSGGGALALDLALAAPGRVTSLVLVAPGATDYPWPAGDPFFVQAGSLVHAGDRDTLLELGLRTWAPLGADEDVTAQLRGAVGSWFAIGDLERADPPAFGRLGELDVPAVVIIGDQEYPAVADAGLAIAARIRGCQTIMVEDADHLLPLRAPGRLADIIEACAALPG